MRTRNYKNLPQNDVFELQRITKLKYLKASIRDNQLTFISPLSWPDQNELFFSKYIDSNQKKFLKENLLSFNPYCICWSSGLNENEEISWRVYSSKDDISVKIITDKDCLDDLIALYSKDLKIKLIEIEYLNDKSISERINSAIKHYRISINPKKVAKKESSVSIKEKRKIKKDIPLNKLIKDQISIKRDTFSFEKEYRLFLLDTKNQHFIPTRKISVDPNKIIKKVIFPPDIDIKEFEEQKYLFENHPSYQHFRGKIERSNLYDKIDFLVNK